MQAAAQTVLADAVVLVHRYHTRTCDICTRFGGLQEQGLCERLCF